MGEPELQKLVLDYLDHMIELGDLEGPLLDLDVSRESALSRKLVGLLAEASHAHWTEDEIRQELAGAVFPFLTSETHAGDPTPLPMAQSEWAEIRAAA
ncbi:MAG: hypothetical protein ABSH00_16190 [Bryobacteraceae bacterium]|jgi:hypothetical protein